MTSSPIMISTREQAVALFTPTFSNRGREELRVAHLDEDRCLIGLRLYDGGGPTMFDFPLRAITLLFGSHGLLIAHNHPSGDPSPSRDDISATRALVRALTALDIRLYDHLILAGPEWSSLLALGLL